MKFIAGIFMAAVTAACAVPAVSAAPQGGAPEAVVAVSTAAPGDSGLTLRTCYVKALQTNAGVAERSAALRATEGRYLAAIGAVLPRLSFTSSYLWQGIHQDSQIPSYFAAGDSMQNRFTATQTLFAGLREFNAVAGLRFERQQRIQEKTRAEQALLAEVSDAFFTAVEMAETVRLLKELELIYQQRIDDLRARERVGRSRMSEIASAMVQLRQNEAMTASAANQEMTARRRLEYLTGLTATGALQDDEIPAAPAGEESAYRAMSERRPDVAAAENAWRSARRQVSVAVAGYLPTVDVTGNYYTRNSGRYQGLDWDIMLSLVVPILPVADNAGGVRQARAAAEAAFALLQSARSTAQLEVRTSFENARSAVAMEAAYRKALDAAEENYRLQLQDYARNLISNLDLLQAIQALQGARRDYVHALYNVKRTWWRLRSAAGESL